VNLLNEFEQLDPALHRYSKFDPASKYHAITACGGMEGNFGKFP
jgi:hypothetical protein